MPKTSKTKPTIKNESEYAQQLIERIVNECPDRRPTSEDERRAQEIMREHFEALDLDMDEHSFKFNESLYANIALHYGIGSLGTIVSGLFPFLGLLMHLSAGTSYYADSTRKGYFFRRAFPFKESRNLMATLPAKNGKPKLRIVFLAHADAAFTGLLFNPKVVKRFQAELPPALRFTKRSLELATKTQFALAGFDLARCFLGPLAWPLRPIEYALSIPSFLAFLLNIQVVLRNEAVPGANDDLSGVAALPLLAQRFAASAHPDVEYMFIVTGCEEASLGGADALARDMAGTWDKENTVVIGLDGLSNGDLKYYYIEGEVKQIRIPRWIEEEIESLIASDGKFDSVKPFEIPVGGTDIYAFLTRGYQGVCLGCVDSEFGSPRHYHVPEDTPENMNADDIVFAVDFSQKLVDRLIAKRLS